MPVGTLPPNVGKRDMLMGTLPSNTGKRDMLMGTLPPNTGKRDMLMGTLQPDAGISKPEAGRPPSDTILTKGRRVSNRPAFTGSSR